MRPFFSPTAMCLLALAAVAGCRAVDSLSTAAADKLPALKAIALKSKRPTGKTKADRPVQRVEFEGEAPTDPFVSLVGNIDETTDRESGADADANEPVTLAAIDVELPPAGPALSRWGHTETANAATEPFAHEEPDPVLDLGQLDQAVPPAPDADAEPAAEARAIEAVAEPWIEPAPEDIFIGGNAHTIQSGDEVEIRFPHQPQFSEKVMVQEDGLITVPLIEPVMAAGLTPQQLQQALAAEYRKLQYDPSAVRGREIEKKYLISVKDRLEIRFDADAADASLSKLNDGAVVRPDGKISLPLIGTLVAEGKTPEELEAEVRKRYREFYREAEPVLIVREFTNNQVLVDGRMQRTGMKNIDDVVVLTRSFERMVFVGGEVLKPGFIRLKGPMTITQAIIAAGGPKRSAELKTVAHFRKGWNEQAIGELVDIKRQWRYEKYKKKPDHLKPPVFDRQLAAYDVVIVPKSHIAKVTDCLEQYVYQVVPFTRNTSFQYVYTAGSTAGFLGF